MNRADILYLMAQNEYPLVSILMPTHRTAPANRQDPIRMKNLLGEAEQRLLGEFGRRDVDPLLARLAEAAAQVSFSSALDGLALYAGRRMQRLFHLPFPVRERVVIDQTFFTRELVRALNRHARYWVLALSEQPARLFEGTRDTLLEVRDGGFPLSHEGPGATEPLPPIAGRKAAYLDERHRQFFRQVDSAFAPFLRDDPLPLVLAGVERHLAYFGYVTRHGDRLLATLTGSHDKTSPHELAKLVWPLVRERLAERRHAVLDELEAAAGARRSASTVEEAWRLGREGRVETVIVEEDFHHPARPGADGLTLEPADDATAPDVIDDAVDEIVEAVLARGGRAVFVDNGRLAAHGRIATILRY